jgi:hypothetical protein
LAAVVFALGLLTAAPTAHERLHGHDDHPGEHSCAVVLFAQGVLLAAGAFALRVHWQRLAAGEPEAATEWTAMRLRLLPPACGPPTA